MEIYDSLIQDTLKTIDKYGKKPLLKKEVLWPIEEKNIYLLDKDTFVELGGYPNESVNLLIQSSNLFLDGLYVIGDPNLMLNKGHISFGKIVILKTKGNDDDSIYDFTQKVLFKDSKTNFKSVMTRASSKHYYINYKVSKDAIKGGIDASAIASTIQNEFLSIDEVESCAVILIFGESNIYKEMLPIAERTKDITLTLNHIFDGISMDCGKCTMNQVCDEVNGLRALHKKLSNN